MNKFKIGDKVKYSVNFFIYFIIFFILTLSFCYSIGYFLFYHNKYILIIPMLICFFTYIYWVLTGNFILFTLTEKMLGDNNGKRKNNNNN